MALVLLLAVAEESTKNTALFFHGVFSICTVSRERCIAAGPDLSTKMHLQCIKNGNLFQCDRYLSKFPQQMCKKTTEPDSVEKKRVGAGTGK